MNTLFLYNSTQTYTSTVFEHLASFVRYSKCRSFFAHLDQEEKLAVNLDDFDAVVIHYSIRLSFDQVGEENIVALNDYQGLKVLFMQDEYDNTHRLWSGIQRLGINLVFTVVPPENIHQVYPADKFPGVRFVSTLTGFVPEELPAVQGQAPSQRQTVVGYRGRHLPIRYGQLGKEKVGIGQVVKQYCQEKQIEENIEWAESSRIYGASWYEFVASCRSTLGSESGSNVFDWDGSLATRLQEYLQKSPKATEDEIYRDLIEPLEIPGLMNQVSPRIFEAIVLRTVLVLFEGQYSGVVEAGVHYIPLKKDFSNLDEVFALLADPAYVDAMAERAYRDVIESERYSYRAFVANYDAEIDRAMQDLAYGDRDQLAGSAQRPILARPASVTTSPVRAVLLPPPGPVRRFIRSILRPVYRSLRYLYLGSQRAILFVMPLSLKIKIKSIIGRM